MASEAILASHILHIRSLRTRSDATPRETCAWGQWWAPAERHSASPPWLCPLGERKPECPEGARLLAQSSGRQYTL
eukprot:10217982-Heterocapsa_arctica.AAC.1